ncbi:hypothetical protein L9F63_023734, partial [Diploptera punctata]
LWPTINIKNASLLENILLWIRPVKYLWDNFLNRLLHFQKLGQKSICYEFIGCFHIRGTLSHLRQVPDHPQVVQTEVWICTRQYPHPSNVNLMLVNWQRGATGRYRRAVSNTELVGRQAGKILVSMITQGVNPADIHVIGFSLGAQIAGFIGETLKENGFRLGKITGLDPAGHLFESRILPPYWRLDHTDADYVEVIHTDGNHIWADGFGVLNPIGHVDYFPNGGFDQPGCDNSLVGCSCFSLSSNKSRACSHGRALELYVELLTSPHCHFVGFSCPGLQNFKRDFVHGNCFQSCEENDSSCGIIGQEGTARGPLYLVTRSSNPYCGQQLKATFVISPSTQITRGVLRLRIYHTNTFTDFIVNLCYSLASVESLFLKASTSLSVTMASESKSSCVSKTIFLTLLGWFIPYYVKVQKWLNGNIIDGDSNENPVVIINIKYE